MRDLGFSDAADEDPQQPMKPENAESVITGADSALLPLALKNEAPLLKL